MIGRFRPTASILTISLGLLSILLVNCEGPNQCDPFVCADLKLSASDNGRSFNLKPGHSVLAAIAAGENPSAESTDEGVIKKTNGPKTLGSQVEAVFVAVGPGSATLTLRLAQCAETLPSSACFLAVHVKIVKLPSTQRQLSQIDSGKEVILRRSDRVLVTLVAGIDSYWHITIEPAGTVDWLLQPQIFPPGSLQGILEAKTPGKATLDAVAPDCPVTDAACSHEVIFYFTVVE